MTSIPIDDFNSIMACLSPEMIDTLQYACQAFIKELFILKKDEEEKGLSLIHISEPTRPY